jgi:uncharacterized protein YpuA (DUF1002 family)
MSSLLIFDTLQYVKRLKEAGVTEKVAEVQAEVLKDVIENNLATKSDIRSLKKDIESLRVDLKRDIELNRKDLIIKLGSMITIAASAISILITLLNKFH